MKIAIFLLDYTLTGGIERWVSVTSGILSRCDSEVTIYSLFKSNEFEQFHTPKGVNVTYLSNNVFDKKYKFNTLKLLKKISYEKLAPYDLILSNNTIITLLLLILKFRIRNRVVSIEHSSVNSLRMPYSFLRRLLYPYLRAVITQSRKSKLYLERFSNCRIIPNPVTPFPLSNQWTKRSPSAESINVLGVFRNHADKQPFHYLEAFDYLQRSKINFNFRTVGFVDEKNEVPQRDGLTFYPATKAIEQHYEWADVLLLLSKSEAYPMVMLEAFSFGVPVLFYDHLDGPNDIVKHLEYNLAIKNGDFENLVQKIQMLTSQGRYQKLQETCLEIAEQFSEQAIYKSWKNLLDDIS